MHYMCINIEIYIYICHQLSLYHIMHCNWHCLASHLEHNDMILDATLKYHHIKRSRHWKASGHTSGSQQFVLPHYSTFEALIYKKNMGHFHTISHTHITHRLTTKHMVASQSPN